MDYEIMAPRDLELDVDADVGDVSITGLAGVVDFGLDVGDVDVNDVHGEVTLRLDVGDMRVEYTDPADPTEDMDARVDVGNLTVKQPAGSTFSVDARVQVGDIDADDYAELDVRRFGLVGAICEDTVGGGGAEFTLRVDVGDIRVRES